MQSDEQQIRQFVSEWMTATRAGDAEKLVAMVADDVVFLAPGQPVMHKADFAAAVRNQTRGADASDIDGHSEIEEIRILGDWAFMWTRLRVVMKPAGDGDRVERAGYTLTILKKQNGKWVLARDANLLATVQE